MNKIKLVLSDIDGVLTDGGMYYSENGDELKKFNTRDGMGVKILRERGIELALVTSEENKINIRRAKKLGIKYIFQNISNKLEHISQFIKEKKIKFDEIAFIGDDINDLELLKNVKYSFCPSDAAKEVKSVVKFQLNKKGGDGVFREMVDFLIERKYV